MTKKSKSAKGTHVPAVKPISKITLCSDVLDELDAVAHQMWENTDDAKLALKLSGAFVDARMAVVQGREETAFVLTQQVRRLVTAHGYMELAKFAHSKGHPRDQRWKQVKQDLQDCVIAEDFAAVYGQLQDLVLHPLPAEQLMSAEEKNVVEKRARRRKARLERHAAQAVSRQKQFARKMELRELVPVGRPG